MKIAWYQPTETYNKKRLVHICEDNPKETICGLIITNNFILWDGTVQEVTCKKCLKRADETA